MSRGSTKKSVLNYSQRQLSRIVTKSNRRKNNSPEKDLEKDEIVPWLIRHKICHNVIDSKAVYSQARGHYKRNVIDPGYPDIQGNNDVGDVVYIELKAPKKRSNLSIEQHDFLTKKIHQNCFAVSVDSVEILESMYYTWIELRLENKYDAARDYLLQCLPRKRKARKDDEPLF